MSPAVIYRAHLGHISKTRPPSGLLHQSHTTPDIAPGCRSCLDRTRFAQGLLQVGNQVVNRLQANMQARYLHITICMIAKVGVAAQCTGIDPLHQAFVTAPGITDAEQRQCIDEGAHLFGRQGQRNRQ